MIKARSCDRCHKRKEECRGEIPCERCKKDGAACLFERTFKKNGRPRGPERALTRGKYSKNGCVACRKQKKKCDEKRPECGNCTRRQRLCWYERSPRREDGRNDDREENRSGRNGKKEESWSEKEQNHKQEDLQEEEGMMNDTQLQRLSQSQNPNLQNPNLQNPNLQNLQNSPLPDLALTPSTFFSATEKMFLDSLLEDPHESAQSSPQSDTYEEQKLTLLQSCMLSTVGIPAKEGELLCYFITNVSMLLFVDKTTTRFLSTVIPLCLFDSRVRYPVIAIASSHRANSSPKSEFEIMRDAVKYRGMAQCCLAGRNSDFYHDTENVLLSLCLVSIREIFEGNSLFWSSALEKGSEIIRLRGGLKKVSSVLPLSIQLFCYLDHISSLSTCATPHVDRSKNNPYANYNGNHVEDILNCKFGFRYGIAGELFKILGNISTLAGLRSHRHKSAEHERQFEALANLIEMKLQNWSPSHIEYMESFLFDENVDADKMALSSYWLALQWSSFLRLHQIREGYNRKDSRVAACLSIILRSLKAIENSTEIESGLMFPLIMAGVVCIEKSDRDYILSRIRSIKEKLRFSYIGEFENLLHAVWERDNDEGDCVNWAKIRFYQFPGLVMF